SEGFADVVHGVRRTHGDHGHLAAMCFDDAQTFLDGAGGSGIQLLGHAFADHAFGVGIDFDGDRTGRYALSADRDVHKKPFYGPASLLTSYKIVTLGGGTGHFALIGGLKKLNDPDLITAVTGATDSGGSSGGLRSDLGVLPPGDARQCLLAFAP